MGSGLAMGRAMARTLLVVAAASTVVAGAGVGAQARVTISYWEKWTGFEYDIIRDVVDGFNRKQNKITVKLTTVTDITQEYLTACAAGSPPDVIGNWNHQMAPFVSAGVVQPLDQYLKVAGISQKDFVPSYWDMMTFKGKVYALPITPSAFSFYWNKGEFADAGLNPEAPPETMDTLMALNEKLTKRDANGALKQVGYNPANPGWWSYLWPVFFGGKLYDEDKNSVDLLATPMVKGYEWVSELSKHIGLKDLAKLNMGDYRSKQGPFFSGKMAMDIQGSWEPSFVKKYVPTLKYGVTSLPYGPGGQPWVWLEADVLFMPKAGRHNREATEFMKYMVSVETQTQFELLRETFSPIRAAMTPDFVRRNNNPDIDALVQMAMGKVGRFAPKTPAWSDLDTTVYTPVWNAVWNQKKTAVQALTDMQKTATTLLTRKGAMKAK